MKKKIACLCAVVLCLSFSACGKSDVKSTEFATAPETGDIVSGTSQDATEERNYIVQPSNAKQELIPGMLMCYLDYVVDDAEYLDHVRVAVTPEIIQSPSQFKEFFATTEQPDDIAKAQALYDEMTATPEGKSLYCNADFYNSWNLIVVSVREENSQTKHTIDSVSYSNDSCIFFLNGTRDVVSDAGEGTVRHFVFRVPKNVYNGVSHSFQKAE